MTTQYDNQTVTVLLPTDAAEDAGLAGALRERGSHAVLSAGEGRDDATVTVLDARGVALVTFAIMSGVTEAHVQDLLSARAVSIVYQGLVLNYPLMAVLLSQSSSMVREARLVWAPVQALVVDSPTLLDEAA